MAFKKTQPPQIVPDSPEKLLLDLPRRKIPSVLFHQGEVIREYVTKGVSVSDVAIQLPTGSGKTLVGLLIAEWRRLKFQECVVYLCTTRQLVHQVVEQANEQYGMSIAGFTGPSCLYNPSAKAEYLNGDRIAVTTYNSVFNTSPFFDSPQTIIVDDSHAAESYIADLWTVRIERHNSEHAALHAAVSGVLKPLLKVTDYARLTGLHDRSFDSSWVEKISTPALAAIADELAAVLDEYAPQTGIRYSWSMLRDHILACHMYISSQEILLRPLIPPTWLHKPFADASHRVFMSATLGAGGDLERLTGRRKVLRLPVPEGWNRQGIGRRYFIFPSMAIKDDEIPDLRRAFMKRAGRSLVLVPSERARGTIASDVLDNLAYKVFSAKDIETSTQPFIREPKAVAIVAGRYDGIDFPNEDCRLLFVDGLPRATNAQERFIMSRMGANVLFNERVQTRVLQAIGRCTRSLQDYSAVVISGEELPEYFNNRRRRSYLHPEMQAELEFGLKESMNVSASDLMDNLSIFLDNGEDWEEANKQILTRRSTAIQEPFPAIEELQAVVIHEIEYQERLWQGDYEAAVASAESVLGGLTDPELRGYRALWHYLAGSAAWLGGQSGQNSLSAKARLQFAHAKEAARGIPWLVELARYQGKADESEQSDQAIAVQVERLETVLSVLGNVHDRQYVRREREILEGLGSADIFENAHRLLGEILGFEAGKVESDASPDPWWISENLCLVFEDHAGADPTSSLDATKARQALSHPNWMKEQKLVTEEMQCLSVLITPVTTAKVGAVPHLGEFALWPLDEFRAWAIMALTIIRELRRTFYETGDLAWRADAADILEQNGLDAASLFNKLSANPASKHLKPETIK